MKKSTLLATLAVVAMASCTEEQYVGDPHSQNGAVTFASNFSAMTRGENKVGAVAATALDGKFVVYGTKHTSAEDATDDNDQLVFNNYQVAWTENTAGTTTSNTHNWEYVGGTAYTSITGTQTIKYWDYGATNGYTFYAFSSKDISYPANADDDKVSVSKTTTVSGENATVYDKGYTVTIKKGASLENLYFSDREPVAKGNYGKPVTLKFRNLTAKVRAGFYETIPGYSVKIDKMYYDNDAGAVVTSFAAMDKDDGTNFVAALQNVKTSLSESETNTLNVSYDTNNKIKVTTNGSAQNLYTLTLGANIQSATSLGTASNDPTWDTANGTYTTVFPFEANANPMLLKVDYTLTSTDGSGETITVTGARVAVPTQYVQWKPNYSYTYLFKISDNTNGTTGTTGTTGGSGDPEGLYPITFDAVVIAATDEQETITEISTNSFTTYTKGKVVTSNDEYVAGNDIYAVLTNTTTPAIITPTGIGTEAGNVQVYIVTDIAPEATVTEATVKAQLIGANTNMTLTALTDDAVPTLVYQVPAADGTNYTFGTESNPAAVKIPSVTAGTTYAIVYCTTAYVAPTYAAVAGNATFSPETTYYFKVADKNVYYPVSGINADNFGTYKGSLFTQTATGTPGVYDVKVIKVKAASDTSPEPEE